MNKWQKQIAEFLNSRDKKLDKNLEQLTRDSEIEEGDILLEIEEVKDKTIYYNLYVYKISEKRDYGACMATGNLPPKRHFTKAVWDNDTQLNGAINITFELDQSGNMQPIEVKNRSRMGSAPMLHNSVLIGLQALGSGRFFRYNDPYEACTIDLAKKIVGYTG